MKKSLFFIMTILILGCGSKDGPSHQIQNQDLNINPLDIIEAALGDSFSCVLFRNGGVKCWGLGGSKGRLGQENINSIGDKSGDMGAALHYIKLGTGLKAVQIDTGKDHACVRFSNGGVKCWGRNQYGQLGLGNIIDLGSNVGDMGDNLPFVNLGSGRTALKISAGGNHSCALLDNLAVKCWGDNIMGQLGLDDNLDRGDNEIPKDVNNVFLGAGLIPKDISTGRLHSCVLFTNGKIKCWGYNFNGQLGQDVGSIRIGTIPGDMASLQTIQLGAKVLSISCGADHTCALLENNSVKCWGYNSIGQLGIGNSTDVGDEVVHIGNLTGISLGTDLTVKKIMAGNDHNCALMSNDNLKCWGDNFKGMLGLGDIINRGDLPNQMGDQLDFVNLGNESIITDLSLGADHSCAILGNTKLKCWGVNNDGRLGLGDIIDRGEFINQMGNALPFVDL